MYYYGVEINKHLSDYDDRYVLKINVVKKMQKIYISYKPYK